MAIAQPVNTKRSEKHQAVRYLAHVRQDGEIYVPHELEEHLRGVAQRADAYARDFGGEDWARVAGLWHDWGNTAQNFSSVSSPYPATTPNLRDGLAASITPLPGHNMPWSSSGCMAASWLTLSLAIMPGCLTGTRVKLAVQR